MQARDTYVGIGCSVLFCSLAAFFVPGGSEVRAELLEIDLYTPGDGLIARDTSSGLDWLDLTITQGISYNGIINGMGGWVAAGWRHATTFEVCELMVELGLGPSPCPGSIGNPDEHGEQVQVHHSFLGVTCASALPMHYRESTGYFEDDNPNNLLVGYTRIFSTPNSGMMGWSIEVQEDVEDPSGSNPCYGHFLVRSSILGDCVNTLYDHFNDGHLDEAWNVTFSEYADGWSYEESGTLLEVTDISAIGYNNPLWSCVNLSRDIPPSKDFELRCRFSWDSDGSVRAMQKLDVALHDSTGNLIALGSFHDGWKDFCGGKAAQIGSEIYFSGSWAVYCSGNAAITIERKDDYITVYWNEEELLSGESAEVAAEARVSFCYYPYRGRFHRSHFGTLSVDSVSICGDAPPSSCDSLWNIKWFHCDRGHDNDFRLERDGTPVCGSGNCPGPPGSCWSEPVTVQSGSFSGISWETDYHGRLSLSHSQDYQVYGDTYLYVDGSKTLDLEVQGGGGAACVWLNNTVVSTPGSDSVTLNLASGWNHFEWTTYHQHGSAVLSIDHPFATRVECMASKLPQCGDVIDNDSDGLSDYPEDLGCTDGVDASELTGDFDNDWDVDPFDLQILALYWLEDEPSVDIAPLPVGDDIADMKDYAVFGENWLKGTE